MARALPAIPGAFCAQVPIAGAPEPERLDVAERAIYATLSNDRRRLEWWCGRIAAKDALLALGVTASVLRDPRGVPRLEGPGADRAHVAITHGRRCAAAAAVRLDAPWPGVGIDLVDAEDGPRLARLAARVLRPPELALAAADPFVRLLAWGTREAVAKATRTGMFAFALGRCWIEAVDPRTGAITTNLEGVRAAFEKLTDGGALVVAGATARAIERIRAEAKLDPPTAT